MAQPPPIRKRRPVWIISAAIVSVIYVAVIGLVLGRQPDPGRASVAELATGMQTALQQRDPDAFQLLFAPGAVPDGYADEIFGQVPDGAHVEARPITVGKRDAVVAVAISGAERWCASWLVVPHGDRLVLSATPALASC